MTENESKREAELDYLESALEERLADLGPPDLSRDILARAAALAGSASEHGGRGVPPLGDSRAAVSPSSGRSSALRMAALLVVALGLATVIGVNQLPPGGTTPPVDTAVLDSYRRAQDKAERRRPVSPPKDFAALRALLGSVTGAEVRFDFLPMQSLYSTGEFLVRARMPGEAEFAVLPIPWNERLCEGLQGLKPTGRSAQRLFPIRVVLALPGDQRLDLAFAADAEGVWGKVAGLPEFSIPSLVHLAWGCPIMDAAVLQVASRGIVIPQLLSTGEAKDPMQGWWADQRQRLAAELWRTEAEWLGKRDNTGARHIRLRAESSRRPLRLHRLQPDQLRSLPRLAEVNSLDIRHSPALHTAAGIRALLVLPNLRRLVMDATRVDRKVLEVLLASQPRVLPMSGASAGGIQQLLLLEPPTRRAALSNIGDAELGVLCRFSGLTTLSLPHAKASARALAGLAKLRHLQTLDLFGCKTLDDSVVVALATLPELRVLHLGASRWRTRFATTAVNLTPASLSALARSPQLRELDLTLWFSWSYISQGESRAADAAMVPVWSTAWRTALGELLGNPTLRRLSLASCGDLTLDDLRGSLGNPPDQAKLAAVRAIFGKRLRLILDD